MATETCEYQVINGGVPAGDADVSGIGVVLAFIVSAYVTFFAVLTAYISGLVDRSLLGPIDTEVFCITPFMPHRPSNWSRAQKYLRKGVLALSDQQIVTGVAIMGAGFQGLRTGSMSVYHFQVVLYLAWMSSSVHLSGTTLLQSYLHKRRGILIWRLSGMMTLLIMLIIGLVPTLWGDGVGPDAPLGFIILAVTYAWKIGGIFDWPTRAYRRYLRNPFEDISFRLLKALAMRLHRSGHPIWLWTFRLFFAAVFPMLACLEFASSFAASIWLSVTSLVYGTIQILVPRAQMLPYTGSTESSWGFGQLVPLILLAQPLGVVFEFLWSRDKPEQGINEEASWTDSSAGKPNVSTSLKKAQLKKYKSLLGIFIDPAEHNAKAKEVKSHVWAVFFSSKLFAAMVYLLQIALAGICTMVFYFDAGTIGSRRSDNWQFILSAIGVFAGTGFCLAMVVSPFSVLCRYSDEIFQGSPGNHEGRRSHDHGSVCNDAETGTGPNVMAKHER
ncbi:hypothetical protein JX266_011421 [Neoarthrinium moseri]|nr:hypothetical protein JX266_011421 [Neoarthrinium moseri]